LLKSGVVAQRIEERIALQFPDLARSGVIGLIEPGELSGNK
jgi:hypothetical protein